MTDQPRGPAQRTANPPSAESLSGCGRLESLRRWFSERGLRLSGRRMRRSDPLITTVKQYHAAIARSDGGVSRATAVHEAGHLLAAAVANDRPGWIRLGEHFSAVSADARFRAGDDWDALVRSVAGLVAEQVTGQRDAGGATQDFIIAGSYAAQIVARGSSIPGYSGPWAADEVVQYAVEIAGNLLRDRRDMLEELADRLQQVGLCVVEGAALKELLGKEVVTFAHWAPARGWKPWITPNSHE